MLTFNHGLQLGSCVEFTGKNAELEQLIVLCVLLYVELHELKTDIPSRTIQEVGYFPPWGAQGKIRLIIPV